MGLAVGAAIKRASGVQPAWFVTAPTVGGLIANPLMAGAGPVPTNWADATWLGSSGTVPTFTIETDTSGNLTAGQWLKMAWVTTAASTRTISANLLGPSYTAGTTLLVVFKVQVEDISGWLAAHIAGTAVVSAYIINGSSVNLQTPLVDVDAPGTYLVAQEVVIAPGNATLALKFSLNAPAGVSVNYRFGQVQIYDLLALNVGANV